MSPPGNAKRNWQRERAAIARARKARLHTVEQRLAGHLRYLRQHDRDGYEALMACLQRIIARQS